LLIQLEKLSKVADGATIGHWNTLLRCIKYIITTEYLAFKLKHSAKRPSFKMEGLHNKDGRAEMEGFSDSEFGADQETIICVFGENLYFCGSLIARKSKARNSVTLSSTEAEYVSLSEITKEVIFVRQVLETIGIGVKLLIIINVYNVGAISLSNNHSLG
jgi:hypothetical protein